MKLGSFDYFAPSTLQEAVSLLADYGEDAKVLAGGQSLIPLLAMRLANPEVVIDLNGIGALSYLDDRGGELRIGALARHREIEQIHDLQRRCPVVHDAVHHIGHVSIRNRGTVVGSMAHADPAAEWPALSLALGAEIEVRGPRGTRTIGADSFFLGYLTTAIEADEIVTEVRLPLPQGRVGSSFVELARRFGDFALIGVASVLRLTGEGTVEDARIVVIGAAGTPLRIAEAEKALVGRQPEAEAFAEAARQVHERLEPPSDLHGSADYRKTVGEVLTRRGLAIAAERAAEATKGAVNG